MLAYVDESGCTGMKLGRGSTDFYAVVAVVFFDREEGTKCHEAIDKLRIDLRVHPEFHFSKLSHNYRARFFEHILSFDFRYAGVIFDKHAARNIGLDFSLAVMEHAAKALFAMVAGKLDKATVVIDKTGSSEFRKLMARHLRDEVNKGVGREAISKVKTEDSHRNCLLQLADMVCGSVYRSFCPEKSRHDCYRKQIKSRELFVAKWP
jgi:hypothetical protein